MASRRIPAWLDGAKWPFLWILLIPWVTGLATAVWRGFLLPDLIYYDCDFSRSWGEGRYRDWLCPGLPLLPSLAPGLLNLVAFAWLRSPRRRVRAAALVAGTLGAIRLLVPVLLSLTSQAGISIHLISAGAEANFVWVWPLDPTTNPLLQLLLFPLGAFFGAVNIFAWGEGVESAFVGPSFWLWVLSLATAMVYWAVAQVAEDRLRAGQA